jgi:hypothetical protein
MPFWSIREELSQINRLRRSYYELLRDELDHFMHRYALVESFNNFQNRKMPYPYVEKRELKPRARIPDVEYDAQNAFIVIFAEDTIPAAHKKYLRFFDVNKTTKTNLMASKSLPLKGKFDRNQKYIDSVHFFNFLKVLLPVDYALLIQRDPYSKVKDRYSLSHFHVRVDWPIADAAEDLARTLRYISKDLYEKGDKYAEDVQKKFFEYFSLPVMAGGRRTAAVVAAQYLKRLPCITTVYAGSSETRALLRVSERGVSKSILVKLSNRDINLIAEASHMRTPTFKKNYVVVRKRTYGICIFQVTYLFTDQSRPPEDGKLREIKPDLNWITVGGQYLLPKPSAVRYPPIPLNYIYTQEISDAIY